jgi:5-methyltetrahydrofolate--homocysteine methyltransferase
MSSGLTIRNELFSLLDRRTMICDGAMGTMLLKSGYKTAGDLLNLDKRAFDDIVKIHLDYICSGSEIIQTNSFGANPVKLKRSGNEDKTEKINRSAVIAAKKAISMFGDTAGSAENIPGNSSKKIYIAGDVGPTGQLLKPYGPLDYSDAVNCFTRQIDILLDSGADFILIETMMDLNEARAAVEAARKLDREIPVACTLSFNENGVTIMGEKAESFGKTLIDCGCDIIGANCSVGSGSMAEITQKIRTANPDARILIQPNAGLPKMVNSSTVFDETPEIMAVNFKKILEYHPDIIGGCCGSTPDHIKKLSQLLQQFNSNHKI